MIDVEGRIKLLDFGVASVARESAEPSNSNRREFKGKLSYAAPELLHGHRASPLSDIYACAVALHEMISGRNEFRCPDPASTIYRVLHIRLSPLGNYRDDVPEGIDDILANNLSDQIFGNLPVDIPSFWNDPKDLEKKAQDLRIGAKTQSSQEYGG